MLFEVEGERSLSVHLLPRAVHPAVPAVMGDFTHLRHVPDADDYYISSLSERDKYTDGCYRCMAAVLSGLGQEDREVSKIAHLSGVIVKGRSGFRDIFSRALSHFGGCTREGTRRIAVAGGFYGSGGDGVDYRPECLAMMELIAERAHEVLGLPVHVLARPKCGAGATDLYYKTSERAAYIVQDAEENVLVGEPFEASHARALAAAW